MEVQHVTDPEACAAALAQLVADAVHGGARHLVLAGGSTPLAAYARLDAMRLPWDGVHLWYGDERCVPFDDDQSNHGAVSRVLLALGATWHPMPWAFGPEAGAAAYARELEDTGASFDLVLNGMGPDGHTASLFPHHPALAATSLAAGVTDSPKPPPERITLTLPALNAGQGLVLLVTGESKRQALAGVLGDPDPSVPASLLDRERLLILADTAALPA